MRKHEARVESSQKVQDLLWASVPLVLNCVLLPGFFVSISFLSSSSSYLPLPSHYSLLLLPPQAHRSHLAVASSGPSPAQTAFFQQAPPDSPAQYTPITKAYRRPRASRTSCAPSTRRCTSAAPTWSRTWRPSSRRWASRSSVAARCRTDQTRSCRNCGNALWSCWRICVRGRRYSRSRRSTGVYRSEEGRLNVYI